MAGSRTGMVAAPYYVASDVAAPALAAAAASAAGGDGDHEVLLHATDDATEAAATRALHGVCYALAVLYIFGTGLATVRYLQLRAQVRLITRQKLLHVVVALLCAGTCLLTAPHRTLACCNAARVRRTQVGADALPAPHITVRHDHLPHRRLAAVFPYYPPPPLLQLALSS